MPIAIPPIWHHLTYLFRGERMASAHSQQVKDSVYGVFLDQEFVQASKTEVPLIATSWKTTSLVTADIEKNAN